MGEISDPRKVIDRRRLTVELTILADDGKLDEAAVAGTLKEALAKGRDEVRRRFDATGDGRMAARTLSYLMDQIIRALHDAATQLVFPLANPSTGERLAVIAVGGYGRGELAPHSDIDLLFLLPYKRTPYVEQVIEYMLYRLWDLGLKVGHSVRSVEECIRQARKDLTIRTALLEARYIWGEQSLYHDLRNKFLRQIVTGTGPAFVEAKLAERNERHRRMGDSRYALEPNIKDGKGGLRDLHTLFWIAKYLYRVDMMSTLVDRGVFAGEEARQFEKVENFLWSLRFRLHYLAGRPEERLTFDLQPELAQRMGYTDHAGSRGVERLMKHYFLTAKTVGDLTRIFCAVLEAQHQKRSLLARGFALFQRDIEGFQVDGDRLTVADPEAFLKDPVNLLRLFEVAQRHDLDIHPASLRLVTRNLKRVDAKLRADPEANRLFVAMLTSKKGPEITLRRLSEAGVFGRFMPDFGRVVAQMQYDMYHHFTVDEHTIFAIGILWRVEQGLLTSEVPIASEVVHLVQSRRVLYLAVLLHDIAKGRRGDHSELGADIALKLGPRLGFSDEETETVSWLVRYHLLMSNTAFKRDIDDPKTIQDFVAEVQSLERLRLLLVLTVADIRAVGPKTWNGWKAQLLRDLYWRAEELISGGRVAGKREERVKGAIEALRAELGDWSEESFAAHVARGTPSYWLAYDKETLARHALLVERAEREGEPLALDIRVDPWRAVTQLTVYTADRPGLFARLAGALALAGANIAAADIFTLTNGKALDSFQVQDAEGHEIDRRESLARIEASLARMLADDAVAPPELEFPPSPLGRRTELFKVAPRVLIDNKGSAEHTLIEVNGRDRRGLLYGLTRALAGQKLQIMSAKVSTFGARAVDVFYVKDKFGLKVEGDVRLKPIRDALMAVLEEGEGKASSSSTAGASADPKSDSAAAE
jgi:[protein-PII] uridylyltransferase